MSKAVELISETRIPVDHPSSIALGNGGIWVSDIEDRSLTLMDPRGGEVLRRESAVVSRPQTISFDGECLWEYDEETSRLFKRNPDTGQTFHYGCVEGVNSPYYGMSWRDGTLWVIAPDQPEFTVHNNIITVVKFPRRIQAENFEAPTYACRGLCHDGEVLWTLDIEGCEIFALGPRRGIILNSYTLPGVERPSSIVVTADRVHTMDLERNTLLTFRLDRSVKYTTAGGRRSDVEIVNTIHNKGPGTVKSLEFFQGIPRNYLHQRVHGGVRTSPQADSLLPSMWDEGEGQIAEFIVKDLPAGAERELTTAFTIDTVNLKFHLYPSRIGDLRDIPDDVRSKYLFEELMKGPDREVAELVRRAQVLFQTGEREIRDSVAAIVEDETNCFWIARKIYNWVIDKVKYVLPYTSITSRKILEQGKGSCGNHATIYIALCQAAGLPARSLIGFSVWKDDSRLGYLDHEIPEVYLPGYGWVPVDTSRFMSLPVFGTHPLTKFRSFGTLSDRFIVNAFGRDFRSPFARKRLKGESLTVCEGQAHPSERFFMRWYSRQIETWMEYPDAGHTGGYGPQA